MSRRGWGGRGWRCIVCSAAWWSLWWGVRCEVYTWYWGWVLCEYWDLHSCDWVSLRSPRSSSLVSLLAPVWPGHSQPASHQPPPPLAPTPSTPSTSQDHTTMSAVPLITITTMGQLVLGCCERWDGRHEVWFSSEIITHRHPVLSHPRSDLMIIWTLWWCRLIIFTSYRFIKMDLMINSLI